jgi:hypothetical protein
VILLVDGGKGGKIESIVERRAWRVDARGVVDPRGVASDIDPGG